MELIEAKTLTTNTANITFSAIPATYTDLCIVVSARSSVGGNEDGVWISQINGSGSNLTNKWLRGSGSSVLSSDSALYGIYVGQVNGATATANSFGNFSIYITDYASANYKSISIDGAQERNATESYMGFTSGLWSNSAAITSITLDTQVGDFVQYSTAYLYGVSNANVSAKATGGVIYSDGVYNYHTFLTTGIFTPTTAISADILVIAGGGGSTDFYGGGGGAGGIAYKANSSLTATAYTCTVGAGGAGASGGASNSGADSSIAGSGFSTITANGGGGGGGNSFAGGITGGSGGGGGGYWSYNITAGSTNQGSSGGSTGYGNNGGTGVLNESISGGGGGAGTVGGNGSGTQAGGNAKSGNGGLGLSTWLSWTVATGTGDRGYFAGGGGGGGRNDANFTNFGQGGIGGGGNGSFNVGSSTAKSGLANTGGGGGGSWDSTGGSGGSGIIIIRYAI